MPKKVEVFALGCAKCRLIEVAANAAVEESGVDAQVERLQDPMEMKERGVMRQPALFIDGVLKAEGRVPTVDEIKEMLLEEDAQAQKKKNKAKKKSGDG
jgi:small redox-active disulfide protein 2